MPLTVLLYSIQWSYQKMNNWIIEILGDMKCKILQFAALSKGEGGYIYKAEETSSVSVFKAICYLQTLLHVVCVCEEPGWLNRYSD
jgi:hypothetical protein